MKCIFSFITMLTIGWGILSITPPAATKLLADPPTVSSSDTQAVEFFEKKVRPVLVERCLSCHGPNKQRGGLRLDSRQALQKGGDNGPVLVPGDPDQSQLIRVLRYDGDVKMPPPPKSKLVDAQVAAFTTWVRRGALWPAATVLKASSAAEARHWSFQPVRRPALPAVKNAGWVQTPVDSFILARLEAQGLAPSSPTDKNTLLRRVTFDLVGLPPTPEEIQAFLEDRSPDAFAKVVDRLLDSPHYGERWGRHWLDLVHYADGQDLESDFPEIWLYRDWVTKAFNRDLPYKDFLTLQIAGDLLQSPGDLAGVDADETDALVATGMLGMTQFATDNLDPKLMNAEYVDDQVDVVGRAMLGLTISCARCHDHKFDPISMEEYYALAGVFFNTRPLVDLKDTPSRLRSPLVPKEVKLRQKREFELKSALEKWSTSCVRIATGLVGTSGTSGSLMSILALNPAVTTSVAALSRERWLSLQRELEELRKRPQPKILNAIVVRDGGLAKGGFEKFQDGPIYLRGNPHSPGKIVPRGVPRALGGAKMEPITQGSGRLQLARWLTSPDNPLTARVLVNHLWQHHFGEGIVRTPGNFGAMGERPTHPELLDYLASYFVQSGWSLKAMHRLLLLSATYQQSSIVSPEILRADPENRLWGRMNRQRLESEMIRDSLLAFAGRLDLSLGGPGFADITNPRRTCYLMARRTQGASYFGSIFDQPSPSLICEKRNVSTVAPQALFLLNDPFVTEQAKALVNRLLRETAGQSPEVKIRKLYLICLGRLPTRAEIDDGLQFLTRWTFADSALPALGTSIVGLTGSPCSPGSLLAVSALAERATNFWVRYCHVIFCTNELVYID